MDVSVETVRLHLGMHFTARRASYLQKGQQDQRATCLVQASIQCLDEDTMNTGNCFHVLYSNSVTALQSKIFQQQNREHPLMATTEKPEQPRYQLLESMNSVTSIDLVYSSCTPQNSESFNRTSRKDHANR
jgi:hypothetical protein